MGDKSIKNTQVKKKKKTDIIVSVPSSQQRAVMTQPELITKKKKIK